MSTNKRLFLRYPIVNLLLSSLLFFMLVYTDKYYKGFFFYVKFVLYTPSFIILAILKGLNEAMHFTTERTYYIVSFISYSAVIAMVQVLIYKRRKKKQQAKLRG